MMFQQIRKRPVQQDAPFADEQDTLGQRFDILHIVSGEDDRGLLFLVQIANKPAPAILDTASRPPPPDGGFIEEQNPRGVQQGRRRFRSACAAPGSGCGPVCAGFPQIQHGGQLFQIAAIELPVPPGRYPG